LLRVGGGEWQCSHDARVEAAEAAAGWIDGEPGEGGELTRVEERRQRVRVVHGTGGDAVDGVQRIHADVGHHGRESPREVRPDHAARVVGEGDTEQLPGRTAAVIAATA